MARLTAHGIEVARLRKGDGTSVVTLSFRSDRHILRKIKHGTYDSGWKLFKRTETSERQREMIIELKAVGWTEVTQ
jgi:hypothetical protein